MDKFEYTNGVNKYLVNNGDELFYSMYNESKDVTLWYDDGSYMISVTKGKTDISNYLDDSVVDVEFSEDLDGVEYAEDIAKFKEAILDDNKVVKLIRFNLKENLE